MFQGDPCCVSRVMDGPQPGDAPLCCGTAECHRAADQRERPRSAERFTPALLQPSITAPRRVTSEPQLPHLHPPRSCPTFTSRFCLLWPGETKTSLSLLYCITPLPEGSLSSRRSLRFAVRVFYSRLHHVASWKGTVAQAHDSRVEMDFSDVLLHHWNICPRSLLRRFGLNLGCSEEDGWKRSKRRVSITARLFFAFRLKERLRLQLDFPDGEV